MKKVLAGILVFIMVFSLFACQQTNSNTEVSPSESISPPTTAAPDTGSASPEINSAAPASSEPKLAGFYDSSYDYSKNQRYKVVHMDTATSDITQEFADSFKIWADKMNCDFTYWAANGDNDLFINTIETFVSQGYNGFLLAPDNTIMSRIFDVCNELDIDWMTVGSYPIDESGKLFHPYVGMDNTQWGIDMATWLIDYQRKTWPDAKISEIGYLSLDFSTVPLIHERTTGAQSVWEIEFPDVAETNFFVGDGIVSGKFDADTGYNITAPIITAHPDIKYWLISAAFDDYAQGASLAATAVGKDNSTVVADCGGSGLVKLWDAGDEGCWKAAVNTPQIIFSEGMFAGLYAFMSGQATPETLWTDWVDHSKGEKYANLLFPAFIITNETYQEQLEFVDAYAGTDRYDYPYNGTMYTVIGDPPASYKG